MARSWSRSATQLIWCARPRGARGGPGGVACAPPHPCAPASLLSLQGGEEHGEKCAGDSCPLIRSRRFVDKASGQMVVELERTLLDGEVVRTRTYYSPHGDDAPASDSAS